MIKEILHKEIENALNDLYSVSNQKIQFQNTRKEFSGDVTLVVFLLKASRKGAEETAQELGEYLNTNVDEVIGFNVVKGFLNLEISKYFWFKQFVDIYYKVDYGIVKVVEDSPTYLVEYSSPNTNKPIHLGHLRNNFLGFSVSEILKASGKNVKKVQIINDRGIHICKSMIAWKIFGNGENLIPLELKEIIWLENIIEFDKHYKKEVAELIELGMEKSQAEKESPLLKKAQEMLIKWESKDVDARNLCKR